MINMKKKYRTRDGQEVRILCVDGPKDAFPVIALVGEYIGNFTHEGTVYRKVFGQDMPFDLIEVGPWDDFKVDEPVMVREEDSDLWFQRHFAKTEDGIAYAWSDGATSWTTRLMAEWVQCRRPTPDELKRS